MIPQRLAIHPFPARMACEIAMDQIRTSPANSVILDPMSGSGTVLRVASERGHAAHGFDMDPLAVLMSSVLTSRVNSSSVRRLAEKVVETAKRKDGRKVSLPWLDADTAQFIDYWFAPRQRRDLRKLAHVLMIDRGMHRSRADSLLKLALSRIIVTKEAGASLARDASHSRPHRVADENSFDVFHGFLEAVDRIVARLQCDALRGRVQTRRGDVRNLSRLPNASIDLIVTSPPYLNAIDYLRGHRLALVWLGWSLQKLRAIRGSSIGTEVGLGSSEDTDALHRIVRSSCEVDELPMRTQRIVYRYALDLKRMTAECGRVTRPGGRTVFVIGDSHLNGTHISNAAALVTAASTSGMKLLESYERPLPVQHRYLPVTTSLSCPLSKRMRKETILTFERAR